MRRGLDARSLACGLFASALAASGVAAAQDGDASESVVLLAPAEVRAEWTAALQIELAAHGAVAIAADVPDVATSLIGDAEAQRIAIEHGARAAVWVETASGAWRLRMIAPSAERARVIPVARDADPRTVALIVVSLLDSAEGAGEGPPAASSDDEPDATQTSATQTGATQTSATQTGATQTGATEDASQADVTQTGATSREAAPTSPAARLRRPEVSATAPRAAFDEAEWRASQDEDHPRAPRGEPYVHWSGRIGISALGIANDSRFELGLTLRGGIAMRYDWLELAVLHDLGMYFEQPQIAGTVQPVARVCLEVGAATPRTFAAFHAGVRGCTGSVYASEAQPGIFLSGPRAHVSGGGYAAVSFALASWIRLFVRADVDVGWTDMRFFDSTDVLPAISTFLSFE